jgi:hypothetical protein
MFNYGEVWVHDCTDDIALHVLYSLKFTTHTKVRAHLINRHNKIFYETRTYVVLHKDLKHWSLFDAG